MKHLLGVAATCLLVAAVVLLLSWIPYFSEFNDNAYDFTLRLAGPITPASPTSIVAIDEDSLQKVGAWPWSRDKLAKLIDRIQRDTPKVIAIDMVLDDDTTPEADDALASAIARTPAIVLAERISDDSGSPVWRKPNPKFIQPHVRLGHIQTDPDLDSITRRIYSAKIANGEVVEALSIEALRAAHYPVVGGFQTQSGGANVLIPQPINIRFVGGRESFAQIAAWKVLSDAVASGTFKNRIVLIGATAAALGDEWFTPFSIAAGQKMSGIEIHANAVETVYAQRYISNVPDLILFFPLALTPFVLWCLDRRFEGMPFYTIAFLMIPGMMIVSLLLLKYLNLWLPFPPFLAVIVCVVPGLEVIELVRVNRDLDSKIERLSGWGAIFGNVREQQWEPNSRISQTMIAGLDRDGWLAALNAAEHERDVRHTQRQELLDTRRRNARWRLHAVDFFNDDLVQFLSFNNAILASIEDVIIVADPAGRVVYQNPAAERLTGYAAEPTFAPDYVSSLLDGRNLMEIFGQTVRGEEPVSLPFVAAADGKHFYTVTLAGAKFGVVISMHDSTAQHELNQAKNDMVSLVSHELRTPLTSIRGYSDMLLKYDLVGEKGKPFLSTIIEESQRLNQLIQSFLDIAYIESGRQKIQKTDFDTGPVFKDMLAVISPVAAAKQIVIEPPVESSLLRVNADRLLLYQALSNLTTNAIKYSPAGTTIRLFISNGGGKVNFSVKDEGCGIPADETAKVFEKFFRRGNRETREQSGFGLGLAFVKEIAVRHGGDVELESEVGKGSTFTLWIPS